MWFIGFEVEQETSAPHPKKNPGSAPENCHLHMPVRPTLLFRKNLGNLREFFGQIVYRPLPPRQKIARTPMSKANTVFPI